VVRKGSVGCSCLPSFVQLEDLVAQNRKEHDIRFGTVWRAPIRIVSLSRLSLVHEIFVRVSKLRLWRKVGSVGLLDQIRSQPSPTPSILVHVAATP
jgi:hypothetical protein